MNKTLSIGLAGFSFTIEEHAYIKLSDYLAALRSSLEPTEADEVMHDIEIRMVEIFKETLGKREVINDADVERVIFQIGKPELIEEQEEAYFSEKTTKQERRAFGNAGARQLFRDPERQKIAGVCAGLAHYTGLDMTAMRAIWLGIAILGVFTAAISTTLIILIYIIFWIVLPKAQTAADFLKMKGKPMNFDNLKSESNKLVQFANESTQRVGEIYTENKPYISNAGNGIWNVIRYILGGIFGIIGLSMLLASISVFGIAGTSNVNFFENLGFYLQDSNLGFLAIALAFLTVFIPALIFCYLAMKLFSPKTKLNNTGYVIGGLALIWIALAAFTGFSAIKFSTQYSGNNDETENVAINTTSDSILVDVKKVMIPQSFKSYWDDVYSDGKTIYKQDYPDIHVRRENVQAPYLEVKKRADGYNLPLKMSIPVEIVGNKILLPNYYSYPYDYRFRDYRVDYELVVPQHMSVIALNNENGFSLSDDRDEDDNHQQGISVQSGSNTIVVPSDNADSIIVNGKKVSKEEAELIIKKMKIDTDSIKDINISINADKKEVSIKTK